MAVKHVYLVRHGETADNRRSIHQSIHVPLNADGKTQAEAAGRALAALHIDTLLASDAERAVQTATAIAEATHTQVTTDRLLRELHRGILIEGTRHLGWQSVKGSLQLFLHANNRTWHNADGENLLEFRDRVRNILTELAHAPGEHVVVVTHRGIINGLRYGITRGFAGCVRNFILAALLTHTYNGSITELTYDPDRTESWRIERANDTKHLAQ